MYAKTSIRKTEYTPGENFLEACPYFDSSSRLKSPTERVFGWRTEFQKAPLVFFSRDTRIDQGFHRIYGDARPYDENGVVMHFLYFSDFIQKVEREAERGVYFMNGIKYRHYREVLRQHPDLSLHQECSVRYEDSSTLEAMGFFADWGLTSTGQEN